MERFVIVMPVDTSAYLLPCDDGDTCKLETLQKLVGGPIEMADTCLAASWAREDVDSIQIPDAQALHQQQRQTRQALDGLAERAWMVEASRKRVGCLPLAPAEVEKRIQTVLQAPAMPESWERRRAR